MTDPAMAIDSQPSPAKPRGRWLAFITWLYVWVIIAWWLAMRYAAERLWFATVLLFGPRWPMLLPLIVLVPTAFFVRPKSLRVLAALALLIVWPIMGLQLNRLPRTSDSQRADLRVLTLNTHFQAMNAAAMHDLIVRERPDVIALQEWWGGYAKQLIGGDANYPYFEASNVAFVASRYPIHMTLASEAIARPENGIFYGYQIDYPDHPITFFNIHLTSPHGSLSDTLHGEKVGINRLRNNASARWSEAMRLRELASRAGANVILAGDFNLPADSPIFRNAFDELSDAFSEKGLGYGWTYRTNRTDVRIDHILTGNSWACVSAWVGPDVRSPHRPLLADYRWVGN